MRENLSPSPTGVVAIIPPCLDEQVVLEKYKHLWVPGEQSANSPVCNAKDVELWTPTFVQIHVIDTLRDDGLIYEKLLHGHGVATRLYVYPGMPHAHWMWPEHSLSTKSHIDALSGIGWLLGQDLEREEVECLWNTAPLMNNDSITH
ncbi:Alpha/Beta hydrolase protein [Penicillium robsamsonii]|uniref:Alpha/Beta hydrolase protein n=1 Tax=Penicillium robsamsonii TaxID=1792511 RepID=UPI002548A6AA|nr:Alpha/Beta hydrolase protein [Penicillium robsamsonii]KAJ5813188.1 Alpha/Beta hydrolase protein [Penicillium robsamsonii]